jgi:hypothetical protein
VSLAAGLHLLLQACLLQAASSFPATMELTEAGIDYSLALTGESERAVLLFQVYEIAHYYEGDKREDGGESEGAYSSGEAEAEARAETLQQRLLPTDVVVDGPAKAIEIRFQRKLSRGRISAEFDKAIRRNAQPDWLQRARPTIDEFVQAIDRDAEAGDRLVYYWLEGGRLIAEFNGERFFSVVSEDFARLIWMIWFGDDPVCDREALLARAAGDGSL